MSRSKNSGTKSAGAKSDRYGGYRFVNIQLSADDRRWLEAADLSIEFPLSAIVDLVAQGYKFSLSEDARNNSYLATLTDIREDSITSKHILSGRGRDGLMAWHSLAYRHFHLLRDGWEPITDTSESHDYD